MNPLDMAAEIMNDVIYLRSHRWTEQQRREFQQKYSITSDVESHRLRPDRWTAEDWFEAATHHAEYGAGEH